MLSAEDFRTEQDFFREKLKLHNRCLHGYGVVCGLPVEPVPLPKDCTSAEEAEERAVWQEWEQLVAQKANAPPATAAPPEAAPQPPQGHLDLDAQIEVLRRKTQRILSAALPRGAAHADPDRVRVGIGLRRQRTDRASGIARRSRCAVERSRSRACETSATEYLCEPVLLRAAGRSGASGAVGCVRRHSRMRLRKVAGHCSRSGQRRSAQTRRALRDLLRALSRRMCAAGRGRGFLSRPSAAA